RPLVQILVVVANIQVRTLKTEVEKGSMVTAVGHGLLHSGTRMWIFGGNANELGDIGRGPGKSYLFCLTACRPEIGLSGARVKWLQELGTFAGSGAFLTILENPRERIIIYLVAYRLIYTKREQKMRVIGWLLRKPECA
ncbi:hypothetical protein CALVIDRAFT_491326, partial [Calocera viscosa TUFC12733]